MKNLSLAFALALAAVGCKKSPAAGPDCAKAVAHSMELSKTEMEKMGTDAAMMQKMADIGVARCKEDKWSADAVKCMTDAKAMADSQGCYGKLTQAQQDKMNQAAMDLARPPHDAGSASPVDSGGSGSDAK